MFFLKDNLVSMDCTGEVFDYKRLFQNLIYFEFCDIILLESKIMILYSRMKRFLLLSEVKRNLREQRLNLLHRMTLHCRLATSPMAGRHASHMSAQLATVALKYILIK